MRLRTSLTAASAGSPPLLGSLDFPAATYGVAASEDLAFVANGEAGLQIVSTYQAAYDVYGVEMVDGVAYLASYYAGVEVLDVTNPLAPYQLRLMPTPSRVGDVAVHGDLVLASGVYLVRLVAGDEHLTGKLTLLN